MMKWITNYSPSKVKSPEVHDKQADEWRRKRNSIFVSDLSATNRLSYFEAVIPAEVFINWIL